MKKLRRTKEAHVADTKYGMGDFYGSGIKQKVGRIRDTFDGSVSTSKKTGKVPKSLA